MTIAILFDFQERPYGGANQFLKALRRELQRTGQFQETPSEADVILANANPGNFLPVLRHLQAIKKSHPKKIVIVRLDGPIALIRGGRQPSDKLFVKLIKFFPDGVIFQSRWSQQKNRQLYNISAPHEIVIPNAPDSTIFYPKTDESRDHDKVKLIASSWSAHHNKGFGFYRYLDENLDFARYDMTFIGNTPIPFRNISYLKPVSSQVLSHLLRQHDIYITASLNDPCSNALIEALACGLPAVARNSGGHPELVGKGGELFDHNESGLWAIELVTQNHHMYRKNVPVFSAQRTAEKYLSFATHIHSRVQSGTYNLKQLGLLHNAHVLRLRSQFYLTA